MKFKMMLLAVGLMLLGSFAAQAQVKIGYTNLEVVARIDTGAGVRAAQ